MGTSIFRGMALALAATALAFAVVLVLTWWGIGGQYMSLIVDVSLVLSCIVAGYYGAYVSNRILSGIVAVLAYVLLAFVLLSFYFQILPMGAVKILTGAVLLALVSALAGKGRSMYGVSHENLRSYQAQKPRAKGPIFPRSLSSISVERSEEAEGSLGWAGGKGGRFIQKGSERIPEWWERGRRGKG